MGQDLKLLIIEDNPGDFVLIEEYLSDIWDSVNIDHAETFDESKTLLETNQDYHSILLDLSLPDMSGEALVKKVVELAGGIPVIVLTGYENQEFGLKTLSMGVADYVLKDEITPYFLNKVITYSMERNRIRQSLKSSETKYREIFNLSPQPMFLIDVTTRDIVDVNEAAIDQYGYSKEEFVQLNLVDIRPQETIEHFESEIEKIDNSGSQFYLSHVVHRRKNGEVFDVEISTSEIVLDGKPMRMALAEDITHKIEAEKAIKQKSKLLAANARVTGALIRYEDWLKALNTTLGIIGEAADVDRVYYFENHEEPETGDLLSSQKIEWTADGISAELDNPELQNIRLKENPLIFSVLNEKKVFQMLVKDIPESRFKEILTSQGIVSILHFPIFVDGRLYGFIGFDDCNNERIWSDEEVQYLQTIGSNIANAIKLRNTTEKLKVNEYKFKSMVEEGGDLIQIIDEDGNFEFVSHNVYKIVGWKAEELTGKNIQDFINPQDLEAAKEDFDQIRDHKQIEVRPFRFKNKNGTWDWLQCSATNLTDDEIINGLLLTATDVTEQKYYNELQRLERDVLEKNTLRSGSTKQIALELLTGIERLHSEIKTSITFIKNGKLSNFCSPSMPVEYLNEIDGLAIGENTGSCGTAAYRKEQVVVSNIFEDPLWEDFKHLGETYNFGACWSQPIFDATGEVFATLAVYHETPSLPTKFERNTIERASQIIRILFDSEEKERAEKELLNSEKRFKALVQEGADLIGILDESLRFKYVSPSVGKYFNEYMGVKAIDLVHPDDRERISHMLEQLTIEKRIVLEPYRLQDHKGNYFWVETIITDMLDEPAVAGYVANSRNVTQQIKREEKLRELSLVAAKTTDAVIITDCEGLITWVNYAFIELTGYKFSEVIGKKPGDFLQGTETDPATVKEVSEAIHKQESIETTILNYTKDGEAYWLNMSIDPIFNDADECTHFIAIERDVTEKIKKEKELQVSLERYDIVNKATSDTIWDLDIKTDRMLYNSNIHNMFGYSKKEVEQVGTWWRDKIHPDDIHVVDDALSNVLKNGADRFQMEYRFKAADGTYKYVFDRAFVIKDDDGNPVRMIGAMQDVTQARKEEERLKLLESVITNTSESVVILNAEIGKHGREIIFANKAFTELTGYTPEEVIGETLHFLNGPETDDRVRAKLRRSMDTFQPIEVEFINYKKNGEKFWVNTSMVPVQNKKGEYTHWVAIGRDISEQKQNEEAIKASLSEKETLLAEIHHRVKNNLAVVSGMMQLQAFESDNEDLQNKIYDSVVRIKTMATVHELLYQSNSFSQLEFSDTLKKLAENISQTLQTGSEINLNIDCAPIKLNINQAIPASLIVNEVLTNAYKHAFKDGKEGNIQFNLTEVDDNITIEIKDDGSGFPETHVEESGSLGTHLIQVLTDQIDGTHMYKNREDRPGALFKLTFNRHETKKGIGNASMN